MVFHCPQDPGPEENAQLARVSKHLSLLIPRLSRDEQRVVIGYFFDQRSLTELARAMACDPERAEALLRTALHTLRRQVSG